MAQDYNRFGFQLLDQCRRSLAKTNFLLSPPGLAFALSMVDTGAQGETSRQMRKPLGVEAISPAALNDSNKDLLSRLAGLNPSITLEIADSLWVDSAAALKPDFIAANKQAYSAAVSNVDF